MTVYNINLGIGWASSGVEYAQAYRAQLLRNIHQPAKFVFMDMILADNIQHLTENIGFKNDEIIWLYSHFTDIKIAPTTYTIDQVLAGFAGKPTREEVDGKIKRFFYEDQDNFLTCYLRAENSPYVERCEYVSRGILVRKDYFSYTRYCTEYFIPKNNQANLIERRFYNEDGTVAYSMQMADGREIYRFPDRYLVGRQELIRYFMQTLQLTKQDLVILDRETNIGQPIFEEAQKACLGVVVHAEHFSANNVDDQYILWNNYYEYQFTNADKVDFFIVATDRQKEILQEQFRHYTNHNPKIYTIPVGSLPELIGQDKPRKPFSMITASRLAQEKHIDWLVRAVIEVHKTLPDITFDIYGSGGMDAKLREIIVEAQAGDYIRLMGHADLTDIYSQHEVYLTASTSEGFGLTLMEAVGSGLPMIGFDVPYGNQTFIEDGVNGYLLPVAENHVVDVITKSYKDAIVRLYEKDNIEAMRQKSYDLAKGFLTSQVKAAWKQLLEEVRS